MDVVRSYPLCHVIDVSRVIAALYIAARIRDWATVVRLSPSKSPLGKRYGLALLSGEGGQPIEAVSLGLKHRELCR